MISVQSFFLSFIFIAKYSASSPPTVFEILD